MIHIRDAHTEPHLAEIRTLFQAYATAFDYHICFEGFQDEVKQLPAPYSPPSGCLLLAEKEGQPVGCIALRQLEKGVCEMKRLFVRPDVRGKKVGRLLAETVLRRARDLGYHTMRLDTLPAMKQARRLYATLGFGETIPYYNNPSEEVIYMELDLRDS